MTGQINNVLDGRTFDIGLNRIRLWGLDAPEEGETGYDEAIAGLTSESRRREEVACTVRSLDRSKAQRCVATCVLNGKDMGETLLRLGLVTIDRPSLGEDLSMEAAYTAAETDARDARRGLWQ